MLRKHTPFYALYSDLCRFSASLGLLPSVKVHKRKGALVVVTVG